jgi:dTDP-4-dehydrorhamnose 3,5-epimerase
VLSQFATFTYQCTSLYDPKADAGIRWNDAALSIDWPLSEPLLSDKDGRTPLLEDVPPERLPMYAA